MMYHACRISRLCVLLLMQLTFIGTVCVCSVNAKMKRRSLTALAYYAARTRGSGCGGLGMKRWCFSIKMTVCVDIKVANI